MNRFTRYLRQTIPTVILLLVLGITSVALAQTKSKEFKVKYISVDHIYLDSGSAEGLAVGDKVQIFRDGKVIANLEVVYTSEHSASCKIVDKTRDIIVGDTAQAEIEIKTESIEEQETRRRQRQFQTNGKNGKERNLTRVSGYLSLQWYQYSDIGNDHRYDFKQPTIRFKLNAKKLWNDEYYFRIKMRSRYNERSRRYNSSVPRSEWRNRLYEVSFSYENRSSLINYKAGRIISNKFSGVGYIDGLLLQHNITEQFHWGLFGGTQPEWQYSDFQTSFQKYGAFVSYQKGDYGEQRFESTLAAAGAYHSSTVSREFLYLQNSYNYGRKWNVYQSLELDINRDWRKKKTGESISMTGLYLTGRYFMTDDLSMGLSYDNRKNYYTYEMRSLADSLFDNAFRQGLRASFSARLTRNMRLFGNSGIRDRGQGSDLTYSYMAGFNVTDLLNQRITLMLRGAGFSNLYTEGFNPSISLSKYFNGGHSFGVSYGNYSYTLKANSQNRLNQWLRLDSRIELPLHMFLVGDFEYDWGDDSEGFRILAEIGYRF